MNSRTNFSIFTNSQIIFFIFSRIHKWYYFYIFANLQMILSLYFHEFANDIIFIFSRICKWYHFYIFTNSQMILFLYFREFANDIIFIFSRICKWYYFYIFTNLQMKIKKLRFHESRWRLIIERKKNMEKIHCFIICSTVGPFIAVQVFGPQKTHRRRIWTCVKYDI